MDETAACLRRMERRIRVLTGMILLLVAAVAAQVLGWMPSLRASEVRTERIVMSAADGVHRSIEISDQGIRIANADDGIWMWLTTPSSYGSKPCIAIHGKESGVEISATGIRLYGSDGALEIKNPPHGTPLITFLGSSTAEMSVGETDIGPGFVSVSGTGGVTRVDGRGERLGVRVQNTKGEPIPLGPR